MSESPNSQVHNPAKMHGFNHMEAVDAMAGAGKLFAVPVLAALGAALSLMEFAARKASLFYLCRPAHSDEIPRSRLPTCDKIKEPSSPHQSHSIRPRAGSRADMVLALFADGQPRRKSQVAVEIGSNRGVAIRAVDDLVRNGFLRRMDDGRFCLA